MMFKRSSRHIVLTSALVGALGLSFVAVEIQETPAKTAAERKKEKEEKKKKRIERHLHLAEFFLRHEGDGKAAAQEYKKVLKLDRGHVGAAMGIAEIHIKDDQPKKAIKVLEKVKKRDKNDENPTLWRALGNAYLAAEDREKALQAWKKAISLAPDDEDSRLKLFQHLLTRYRRGEANLATELAEAAREYRRVAKRKEGPAYRAAERIELELSGDDVALIVFDARAAYDAAFTSSSMYGINEKMADARRGFEKCIELQPENQTCHYWLGMVFASVKASDHYDRDRARKTFQKASDLPDAHFQIARLDRVAGQLDEAEKALRNALKIDQQHQRSLLELGIILKLQGENEEALKSLERAYRADTYSSLAERAIDEIAKIQPEHPLVTQRIYYGEVSGDVFNSERFKAAVALVERSLGGVNPKAEEQPAIDEIMRRLLDAADVESRFEVRAQIVRTPMPNALALPNGNIYITRGMLDFMKKQWPDKKLDANHGPLGFVLAHELAHVIRRHTMQSEIFREAVKDAKQGLDAGVVTHVTRLQEIDADRVGQVLSFLAGYNPRGGIELMEAEGQHREIPANLDHPSFDERVHYLEEYWSNDVQYAFLSFTLGVREMQKGRRVESLDIKRAARHYEMAIDHFRNFRITIKPTKRVLNNLGVAYSRLGLYAMSGRGSPLNRWLTAFSLEEETSLRYVSVDHRVSAALDGKKKKAKKGKKGATGGTRGAAPKTTKSDEPVPEQLLRAYDHFSEALARDQNYARARANLAVAYLAAGDAKKAMETLKPARAGKGAGAGVLWTLRGVAAAELGNKQQAEKWFQKALKRPRVERAATYNLARLHHVSGNKLSAKRWYKAFLKKWPKGAWARAAKSALKSL